MIGAPERCGTCGAPAPSEQCRYCRTWQPIVVRPGPGEVQVSGGPFLRHTQPGRAMAGQLIPSGSLLSGLPEI